MLVCITFCALILAALRALGPTFFVVAVFLIVALLILTLVAILSALIALFLMLKFLDLIELVLRWSDRFARVPPCGTERLGDGKH